MQQLPFFFKKKKTCDWCIIEDVPFCPLVKDLIKTYHQSHIFPAAWQYQSPFNCTLKTKPNKNLRSLHMAERVSIALNTTTTTMASSLRTQVSASRLLRFSSSGSKLSFPSSSLSFTRSLVSSPLLSQVPSQFFISLFLYPI